MGGKMIFEIKIEPKFFQAIEIDPDNFKDYTAFEKALSESTQRIIDFFETIVIPDEAKAVYFEGNEDFISITKALALVKNLTHFHGRELVHYQVRDQYGVTRSGYRLDICLGKVHKRDEEIRHWIAEATALRLDVDKVMRRTLKLVGDFKKTLS